MKNNILKLVFISITLMLSTNLAWGRTLYFNPGLWNTEGAWYAGYARGEGKDNIWLIMSPCDNNGNYSFTLPNGYTGFKFCRMKPSTDSKYHSENDGYNWTNPWNQTGDITLVTDGMNFIKITDWGAYSWDKYYFSANNSHIYFDNSSNWQDLKLLVGRENYSNTISDLALVANTQLRYKVVTWSNYTEYGFIGHAKDWGEVYNAVANRLGHANPSSELYSDAQLTYSTLFIPQANSGTNIHLSKQTINAYSDLNHDHTITIQFYNTNLKLFENSSSAGAVSVSSFKLTGHGTSTSVSNPNITSSATLTAAYTATTTLTATPKSGYEFVGWYDGDNCLSESPTYTYSAPNHSQTICARFAPLNAKKIIYLNPNIWKNEDVRFAIYAYAGNLNAWFDPSEKITVDGCNNDYYKWEIPVKYTAIIFCRMKKNSTNTWVNRFNQTNSLNITTQNIYTIEEWGDSDHDGQYDDGEISTGSLSSMSLTMKHTPYGEYSVKYNNVTYNSSHIKDIAIDILPGATFEITQSTSFDDAYDNGLIIKTSSDGIYEKADLNTTYSICGETTIQENFVTTASHVVYLKVPKSIASSWNISGTSNFIYSYDNLNVLNSTVGSVIKSSATSTDASFNTYTFTIPAGCHSFRFESKTGDDASASKYTDDFTHILPLTQTNCYTLKNVKDGDLFDGSWDLNIANGDYRILYIHQKVAKATQAGETWKTVIDTLYQHSSDIIKKRTTQGEDKNIVSLFIHRDATLHPEILLQQMKNGKWVDLEMRMVMGPLTAQANAAMLPGRKNTNGEIIIRYDDGIDLIKHDGDYPGRVYNFTVQQFKSTATSADTARLLLSELHPYSGNYYIRTDNAEGGWMNYTLPGNIMSHHEYPLEHSGYSHYFCKWVETTATPNTKFLVANDYGAAISDTITGDLFTDEHGTISTHANIRWMWNEYTNLGSRAYIAGSHEPNFLIAKYASNPPVLFKDKGDWVYEADLENVLIGDKLTNITAHYTSQDQELLEKTYQEEGLVMLTGDAGGSSTYTVRVIYDFKINRTLVYLIPNANVVTTNIDVIIERTNQDEEGRATQVQSTISPANEEEGFTVYGLINLTKDHITDPSKSEQETLTYWISFPFDVKIGDIFGFGEVGKYWMIKYYDGAERAEKGWFLDTKTFWKFFMDTDSIMRANTGYVLTLNKSMLNTSCPVYDNTSTLQLYFPSLEKIKTNIHADYTTTTCTIPAHICKITSPADRTIKDSNWNLIGIPSYANKTEETTNTSVKYFYDYQFKTDQYQVAENAGPKTFYSMHAYMVQFGGTIDWSSFPFTGAEGLAAKRMPSEEPENHKLRLELQQTDQKLDHTFIELQTEGATELFDMNSDLTKIFNANANIYSIITHNGTPTELAANVLPLDSCVIPLGVQLSADGEYTFAMPNGTDGIVIELLDYETNTTTNLLLDSYTVALTAGTIEHRFALSLKPEKPASTVEVETLKTANGELRKYIIDGRLFLRKDGALYDAQGKLVR